MAQNRSHFSCCKTKTWWLLNSKCWRLGSSVLEWQAAGKNNWYSRKTTGFQRCHPDWGNSRQWGHFEGDFLNVCSHRFVSSPLSPMSKPCFQLGWHLSSRLGLKQLLVTALSTPFSWIPYAVQYPITAFLALTPDMCFSFNPVLTQGNRIWLFWCGCIRGENVMESLVYCPTNLYWTRMQI